MNLTPPRLKTITPILERSVRRLASGGSLDPQFEKDLKEALKTKSYQALKPLMIQLAGKRSDPAFRLVALKYMEGGVPGVVREFQKTLAEAYELAHYKVDKRLIEFARGLFWETQLPKLKAAAKALKGS